MRIGVVHNWYRASQPSGENTVVSQQLAALAAAGHDVRLFGMRSDDIADSGPVAKALVPLRVVWSQHSREAFADALVKWRPDVVHVHNTFPLISPAVLGPARRLGIPVVATLHNFRLLCANGVLLRDGHPCVLCLGTRMPWPAVRYGCYRDSPLRTVPVASSIGLHRLARTWIRNVTLFTVPSEFVLSRYVGKFPAERIVVKPNAVRVPPVTAARSAAAPFVFAGRLSSEKGVGTLLAAWRSEFGRLVLVGDGPLRAAAEQAAAADRSIQVVGLLSWSETMAQVAQARALVVPSISYETFGLTVIEAFAYGVPVIASSAGGLAELVTDGEVGCVVQPGDRTGLQSALRRLLDNGFAADCGRRAAELYRSRFTAERDLVRLEAIYRRVLNG